jgi:hypothetical protein
MKCLGIAAVTSTAVSESHYRKLIPGFEMSESMAGLVSYVSVASVSMLLVGGALAAMFWVCERKRELRRRSPEGYQPHPTALSLINGFFHMKRPAQAS